MFQAIRKCAPTAGCPLRRWHADNNRKDIARFTVKRCYPSFSNIIDSKHKNRNFSTTSSTTSSTETVLFQRPSSRNDLILKSAIFTGTFHTTYWMWYIYDFIPLVNNSSMPELHIDPVLGWTGLVFAVAIQAMVVVYPKRLVSKLSLLETTSKASNTTSSPMLHLYTYSLLVRPTKVPIKFKVGELTLDSMSPEAQQILYEYRGNLQLFRGRLGLKAKKSSIPFLLDIRHDSDVLEPRLLLQAVLADKDLPKQHRATDNQPLRAASLSGKVRRRKGGLQQRRR
ncbi:hypothetical protein MPSEU_000478600 [Mayamaea pseudoterrestris]|nr:hypothetical protein MPSEU_000478600 [Mayamaea pseudoterrestris]